MVNQHLKYFLRVNYFPNPIMIVIEYENIVIILLTVANDRLLSSRLKREMIEFKFSKSY